MGSKIEVVISGIGGIFPKAFDLDDFKELLLQNAMTSGPPKWNSDGESYNIGHNIPPMRDLQFDPTFFSVHRSQTIYLDPITRMMLEKTFEAIIDAGVNPAELRGQNIPVITGITLNDSDVLMYDAIKSGVGITGQARTMMSNRISYWLNVTGPSFSSATSWTDGVNCLMNAVNMIQDELCDSVIVGVGNCMLVQNVCCAIEKIGLLSQDGTSRAFDEKADGYSRGDGIVVLYLQRAELAKRNYASILYANCIFNGFRDGHLISHETKNIYKFLKESYEKSGINPNDIEYLEAYGCGIKEIDEAELDAVEKVFCKNRTSPLKIGSVKTNVGHSESSSALVSLIKVIIAMETGIIPAQVTYEKPNPNIPSLHNNKIKVVDKNTKWSGGLVAINSFGLSSNLGHIIVRSNKKTNKSKINLKLPLLLNMSTRTEDGIKKILEEVKNKPEDLEYYNLIQESFSQNINGHIYRGYVFKGLTETKTEYKHYSGSKRPIWFVYSGMGSQWNTMGRDLMNIPVFANAINKCHEILKPKGLDLLKIITDDDPNLFENILNSFVGIAAIQIGLTDVLSAIGIVPDKMIGHSVGELGCAYADGCLTAEEMILSAYYRGKASLEANLIKGMMAAIGMGYKKLKSFCPSTIAMACHNSNESTTISGPVEEITKFVNALKAKNIFAKMVNVSNIAYHSQYIRPAAPKLLAYLKEFIREPKTRSSKWISTSIPEKDWNTDLAKTVSAEYLTNNLLSSVLFEEASTHIPNDAITIEIAPHGLLQAILKRALPEEVLNVGLTKRNANCLEYLFLSLGDLYNAGLNFNMSKLYPQIQYPVSTGTRSLCKLVHWEHGDVYFGIYDTNIVQILPAKVYRINLNTEEYEHLNYNQINKEIVFPPSVLFLLVNELFQKQNKANTITFNNVVFSNPIVTSSEATVVLRLMIQNASGHFEITYGKDIVISGEVTAEEKFPEVSSTIFSSSKSLPLIDKNDFYVELNARGYNYCNPHRCVSAITLNNDGFSGKIECENWEYFINGVLQMHLFQAGELNNNHLIPKYIEKLSISLQDFNKSKLSDCTVNFNKKTNIIISNNGIYMSGIMYDKLNTPVPSLSVKKLKFTNRINKIGEDIQEGFEMSLNIIKENMITKHFVINELKDEFSSGCTKFIENSLNNTIKAEFKILHQLIVPKIVDSSLLVISGNFVKNLKDFTKLVNNFVLVRLLKDQPLCIADDCVVVAEFGNSRYSFYLLKKANRTPIKIVTVKDNVLPLDNIKSASNDRVFIVSRVVPKEGIKRFVEGAKKSIINSYNLRFLFILDSTAPECTTNSAFYKSVFEQDLIVSIYNDGKWGNYTAILTNSNVKETMINNSIITAATDKEFSKVCNVNYLGLHVKDLTRNDDKNIPVEICAVDYTGVNNNGCNIMGIAKTDLNGCKLIPDPEFIWPVPINWNLCDAATVPYAYTIAYYTLFEICKITKGDSVLIHAGCTAIGQAALHVAFNYGCNVYTTVATDQQKSVIKHLIPGINDECIMSSENCNFELQVLWQTKGKGVDVVLNCLPGARLHASKRCLTTYGRFIQLGILDAQEYETTGMNIFLKCTSFHGVRVDKIFDHNAELKKRLHQMIAKDIKTGIVKPIARKIFTENRTDYILRYLRSSTVTQTPILKINNINSNILLDATKNSLTKFNPDDLYFIYADMKDTWIYLVEWLLKRGARKVLVAKQTTYHQNYINRYLSLLKRNYNAEIIITNNIVSNVETARHLLKASTPYGTIMEAFVFANDENTTETLLNNIDTALNQEKITCKMVCFIGEHFEKPFVRTNGKLCNILWENEYSVMDIMKNLDLLLTNENNLNVTIKNKSSDRRKLLEAHAAILPNLKTMIQLGISNEFSYKSIVQLTTKSDRHIREVPPIFIVPGLSGIFCPDLRRFVSQIIYPCFGINITGVNLDDNVAVYFAKEIMKNYKLKLYNLMGVSWGGILAIEIAKEMENLGAKVFLEILEGAPKVIQTFTNKFNKSGEFDMDLLEKLLNVPGLKAGKCSLNITKYDYKRLHVSVEMLKKYIEFANFYKPQPNKFKGPTILIRPEIFDPKDNCNITEHCLEVRYKFVGSSYRAMIKDKKLIDFINDSVIFC